MFSKTENTLKTLKVNRTTTDYRQLGGERGNCYQNFVSLYFEVREFSSYSRCIFAVFSLYFRCRSLVLSIYVFLCNFPANIPKVIV